MSTINPKQIIKKVPGLRACALWLYSLWKKASFSGSQDYWKRRYEVGGNSGEGSRGILAQYKAQFLNEFVDKHAVASVVEFGCGDGVQLSLAQYPRYLGLDISVEAIKQCQQLFSGDSSKSFMCYVPEAFDDKDGWIRGELVLSLDVLYHLVEDVVYQSYMKTLFTAAAKWVVIYSSSSNLKSALPHVRHRDIVEDIRQNFPGWELLEKAENPFAYKQFSEDRTSFSNFYVFGRVKHTATPV